MGLSPYDKDVVRGFNRWLKTHIKETREKRAAAVRRFLDYVKDGMAIDEAKGKIREAFDLTDRQLHNIISGRALLTHDGAVDMTAKIQRVVHRAEIQIELITEHMNDVLEEIDQAERDGVDRYEMEFLETERTALGGIENECKTKSLPLNEARSLIRRRFLAELKQFTSIISDLVPNHVIQTTIYNNINQQEVEDEVRALIRKNRLSDDTFLEKKSE
jgi:hypothetical protein